MIRGNLPLSYRMRVPSPYQWYNHAADLSRGAARISAAVGARLTDTTLYCPHQLLKDITGYGVGSYTTTSDDLSVKSGPSESERLTQTLDDSVIQDLKTKSESKEIKRFKRVPSTRIQRAATFSSLIVKLGWDKLTGNNNDGTMISLDGHRMIASTLGNMRGSVMKLGQMLSIQDDKVIPKPITAIFESIRDGAAAMPLDQLEDSLSKSFGEAWREKFVKFEITPIAAASIGQVHRATIYVGEDSKETKEVAVKVQYPGVAESISSDVKNLKMLMNMYMLPSGLFVDNILKELEGELTNECQYLLEAHKQQRYRSLVMGDPKLSKLFNVPDVVNSLTTNTVLTTEYIKGVNIDEIAKRSDIPQSFKNYLAEHLMLLTLKELFQWRFMQTDPNFSNFLFDPTDSIDDDGSPRNKVHLLDFGAAREYDSLFIDDYMDVVAAAGTQDAETILKKSKDLGFLTGMEMPQMLEAHVSSTLVLGKPFRPYANDTSLSSVKESLEGVQFNEFDFSAEHLPSQIQSYVPTMLKLRLRPPPTPIYSLHRRLSGTILLCTKLDAKFNSAEMFWKIYHEEKRRKENAK